MSPLPVEIVVAMDHAQGIGVEGELPWRLPKDMAHFRQLTTAAPDGMVNAVVMGRHTWRSIPERFRPLAGRYNLVLSRSARLELPDGVTRASSFEESLRAADAHGGVHKIFAIGGAAVYAAALRSSRCTALHITRVDGEFPCDTFFPEIPSRFALVSSSVPQTDGAHLTWLETYGLRP